MSIPLSSVLAMSCRRAELGFASARFLVQASVLDRDPGRGGQSEHQLLVDVGEHLGRGLVGQVEVPENLAVHGDRDAEKRRHRRMVGREAGAAGMITNVGET